MSPLPKIRFDLGSHQSKSHRSKEQNMSHDLNPLRPETDYAETANKALAERKALAAFSASAGSIEFKKDLTDRKYILDQAAECVTKNRQEVYGPAEDSFQQTADLWNAYLQGREINSVDVSVLLALLKIARISTSPNHIDNWVDLAGYAACGGEIATKGTSR